MVLRKQWKVAVTTTDRTSGESSDDAPLLVNRPSVLKWERRETSCAQVEVEAEA